VSQKECKLDRIITVANVCLGFDIWIELSMMGDKPYLQLCNYCFIAGSRLCFSSDWVFFNIRLEAINVMVHLVLCFQWKKVNQLLRIRWLNSEVAITTDSSLTAYEVYDIREVDNMLLKPRNYITIFCSINSCELFSLLKLNVWQIDQSVYGSL
jgi:hypothetical protein